MLGLIDVKEAARRADYTSHWIRVLIRQGKVYAVKKGNKWYVSTVSLYTYVTRQKNYKRRGRPKKERLGRDCEML